MKTLPKTVILLTVLMFTVSLLSWIRFTNPPQNSTAVENFQVADENDLIINMVEATDWLPFSPGPESPVPAAEDVLIQKIPGDKSHLLMMAFYSKENYSGKFVTLDYTGEKLVFRDDGNGDDKKAGDGLFTAKINADVDDFRQLAIGISDRMKKSGEKPVHFIHRSMQEDPDEVIDFDLKNFDANKAVSISSITNAADTADALTRIRANCMVITNLKVVEDPSRTWNSCTQKGTLNGPWTFKTIMRNLASTNPNQLANNAQTSNFVKDLFNHWANNQVINGDTVKARTKINDLILTPWLKKSEAGGAPTGQLDMKFAPFKLTAIINRFDLRQGQPNGIPGSPVGEGRFVFAAIRANCNNALKMAIILEYSINVPNTCADIKAMAQQWVDLKNFTLGSSEYNQALEAITNKFALCGSNPGRPNQSSLDQLRTNEIALSPDPTVWELREFVLNGTTHLFKENTVAQTPIHKYNDQANNADVARMVAYIREEAAAIKAETNSVPLIYQGFPFLGAVDHISGPPVGRPVVGDPPTPYHWDGTSDGHKQTTIVGDVTRERFSFNTCSGCHAGETQTAFTHIDPVNYGTEATISGFLSGRPGKGAVDFDGKPTNDTMAVKDPALRPIEHPTIRNFNDIKRRAAALRKVANQVCGSILSISSELMFQPVNSPD